jgi:hypothetical protein
MASIKTTVGGISRRFLLGAVPIGWFASASRAFATSPNLFFFDARLLVIDYWAESASPQLWPFLWNDPVLPQLVPYIEAEFARLGINIPIALRQNFSRLPAGIHENAVLYVTIRIDLSKTSVNDSGDVLAVGAVSLHLSRMGTNSWSQVPFELFAVPFRDELVRSTVVAAAKRHLAKSLIEPIAANLQ